jgi:hypothetical protein
MMKCVLLVDVVFRAFGEKQLKCGFIQSKKEYVHVVGKKMVIGGIFRNSLDNMWNIRYLFLNIGGEAHFPPYPPMLI